MNEWYNLATALIAPYEGCGALKPDGLYWPYLDKLAKPPVWTQGYGITYGITEDSPGITKEEAKARLAVGVRNYGNRVLRYSPKLITRPQCLAAVTSWAWNCGTGAYAASRLRRAINEDRWEDAIQLIKKPDTAGGLVYRGLVKRRLSESLLFAQGV